MTYTNEYDLGWGAWAKHFGFSARYDQHYAHYTLPVDWRNGWIIEVHPRPGLFAASAWFTPNKTLKYTMHIDKACLWLFCIDCGDILVSQKGKATYALSPFNRLLINPKEPITLTIPEGSHVCFTSLLLFDEAIQNFLSSNQIDYPMGIDQAKKWRSKHINQANVMLVMEQIRWGIRGNRMPAPAYLCKAMELLFIIDHNANRDQYSQNRRHHVTWNDEMKLYRVSDRIDLNPLEPPSMEEMCRLAEMSESKLRIAFKSLYGITLLSYIKESVMKRAMQMLADDELSIKNIALICGYENPAKFTAAFKRIHDITPSDFRKNFEL